MELTNILEGATHCTDDKTVCANGNLGMLVRPHMVLWWSASHSRWLKVGFRGSTRCRLCDVGCSDQSGRTAEGAGSEH